MCCGKAFWKRFFVFGLTFWIGVLVSSFITFDIFAAKVCTASKNVTPVSIQNVENPPVPETKKCVPVDANLQYERLTADGRNESESRKAADSKKALKQAKEKQKESFKPEKPLFDSSNDAAAIKDALHREQCFETREPK
jgi:hypothetical protein